jgi:hypothetical protein
MRCASATSLPLFVLILSLLLCQPGVFAEPAAAVSTADVSAALDAALGTLDATILDDDWSFTMEVVEEDERSPPGQVRKTAIAECEWRRAG